MHTSSLSSSTFPSTSASHPGTTPNAVQAVLALAKRLHRAATSESLALSLPALRRILASQTLRGISLPQLRRQRAMVQRKHVLQTLAAEAGFPSWEQYRKALVGMTPEQLGHFDILRCETGYPNLWFSSLAQAQAHASEHGGRALQVGHQAVVVEDVALKA